MTPSADVISITTERGIKSVSRSAAHNDFDAISDKNDGKFANPTATHLEHAQQDQYFIPMVNRVLWESGNKVKVISIGCGFSGLTLAQKIQHKYKLDHKIEHVIYEKNSEIGGTWFEVSFACVERCPDSKS